MRRNLRWAETFIEKASNASDQGEADAAMNYVLAALQAVVNELDDASGDA